MSNADPGRARPVFQWLAQLFALMGKEGKQIIRDPSSYLVAAILPMIFLLLFGYGITLDAGVMDIVILDESNSQSGLQLQENFAHSPNFRVHQARSRSEAGRMMRDSVISGFIVIPYNFEALLVGGQGKAAVAPIQVIVSGGEPNTANFIRGYSQGVIANWQQTRTPGGTIRKQPVDVAPRYWFNPAAKSRWYLVPGSITIVMTRDHAHGLGHCPRVRAGNDGIPFRHARDPDADPARKAYPVLLPRHVFHDHLRAGRGVPV